MGVFLIVLPNCFNIMDSAFCYCFVFIARMRAFDRSCAVHVANIVPRRLLFRPRQSPRKWRTKPFVLHFHKFLDILFPGTFLCATTTDTNFPSISSVEHHVISPCFAFLFCTCQKDSYVAQTHLTHPITELHMSKVCCPISQQHLHVPSSSNDSARVP